MNARVPAEVLQRGEKLAGAELGKAHRDDDGGVDQAAAVQELLQREADGLVDGVGAVRRQGQPLRGQSKRGRVVISRVCCAG